MSWFTRWRDARAQQRTEIEEGLRFTSEQEVVTFRRVRDLGWVLQAIEEVLAQDAVLYLEGSRRAMEPEVVALLEANAVSDPQAIWGGTIWPKSAKFHVPATPAILRQLQEMEGRHAAPEICDHLVVYRGDEVLLTHYDAGDGDVVVAKNLPEEDIGRIGEILGVKPTAEL